MATKLNHGSATTARTKDQPAQKLAENGGVEVKEFNINEKEVIEDKYIEQAKELREKLNPRSIKMAAAKYLEDECGCHCMVAEEVFEVHYKIEEAWRRFGKEAYENETDDDYDGIYEYYYKTMMDLELISMTSIFWLKDKYLKNESRLQAETELTENEYHQVYGSPPVFSTTYL